MWHSDTNGPPEKRQNAKVGKDLLIEMELRCANPLIRKYIWKPIFPGAISGARHSDGTRTQAEETDRDTYICTIVCQSSSRRFHAFTYTYGFYVLFEVMLYIYYVWGYVRSLFHRLANIAQNPSPASTNPIDICVVAIENPSNTFSRI